MATAVRSKLSEADQAKADKIADGFANEATGKLASQYAAKLIKKSLGLRASNPPIGKLTKEEADWVREQLGFAETPDPDPQPEEGDETE